MSCGASKKDASQRPQSASDVARYLDTVTGASGQTASPSVLLGGQVSLGKALAVYAVACVVVVILAKAAIIGIGLPDWVFPASLIAMGLGLPAVLFTAYVQRTARHALTATPTLTPGGTPMGQGTMATMAMKASPHVSWRRTTLGGVAAVGALIVLTGAWMGMRALGIGPAASLISSGKLGDRERVILADFKSPPSDSLLGPTVTEAFRTDIGQSRNLSVMPASNVRAVLQLMQRPTNVRVDYAVAREIATREGIKAVIDGEVVALGGSYVLSARLVSAQSGEELATFRETADAAKDIIPAISRLSKDLRSKVGESLRAVPERPSLDKVTTPSLEALQRYVAATRAIEVEGDYARFEELMNQAITLDTGFAMAYRKLAIEMNNRGIQRSRVEELLQKAFDHVDRLSEAERYIMLGSYYSLGATPDDAKATSAYESLLEIDPENVTALNNLASIYHDHREYAKAEELARRAIAVQPTASVFFVNLLHDQVHQGKLTEAAATIALAAQNLPRNPEVVFLRTEVDAERLFTDSAAAALDSLVKARPNDLPTRRSAEFELSSLREVNRRLARVNPGMRRRHVSSRARACGNRQASVNAVLDTAYLDYWYRGQNARALQAIERAVSLPVFDSTPPARRPYPVLVEMYSALGRNDKAQAALRAYAQLPMAKTPNGARTVHGMNGMIARAERRYDEAITEFRAADGGSCTTCALPDLALTYDQAGNLDSALAVFSRFVSGHATNLGVFSQYLALSHKRMGELYDQKGNADSAMTHYAQFIDLWKNADAELQPQVQKARERLRELQRQRG